MKTLVVSLSVLFLASYSSTPSSNTATVDTDKSRVEWLAEKVTGKHWGTVNIQSGTIELDGSTVTGGTFEIDMTSILVSDIKDEGTNAKLVGHLKSEDFFSVSKNPTANFTITSTKPAEGTNGNNTLVTGKLTIKGITDELTFPARISVEGNQVKAYGSFMVDRTKWDIKYGSGSFFEGLGDRVIYDEFNIKLDVTATL